MTAAYRTYRRQRRPRMRSSIVMIMMELKTMIAMMAQIGMTRVMTMGGARVGGGLLLSTL